MLTTNKLGCGLEINIIINTGETVSYALSVEMKERLEDNLE